MHLTTNGQTRTPADDAGAAPIHDLDTPIPLWPVDLPADDLRTRWRDTALQATVGQTLPSRAAKLAHARTTVMEMTDDPDAPLVSSLCVNGLHAPALDLDMVHRLRTRKCSMAAETLTGGRTRLVFKMRIHRRPWLAVQRFLAARGWAEAAEDWQLTRAVLVLTAPSRVLPSSTPGNWHLYIDRAELTWGEYHRLLGLFQRAGITIGNAFEWSVERGQSMLLRPGLTKAKLRAGDDRRSA